MSNLDPNAILRGAQLTLVGGKCLLGETPQFQLFAHELNHRLGRSIPSAPESSTLQQHPLHASSNRDCRWLRYSSRRRHTNFDRPDTAVVYRARCGPSLDAMGRQDPFQFVVFREKRAATAVFLDERYALCPPRDG